MPFSTYEFERNFSSILQFLELERDRLWSLYNEHHVMSLTVQSYSCFFFGIVIAFFCFSQFDTQTRPRFDRWCLLFVAFCVDIYLFWVAPENRFDGWLFLDISCSCSSLPT